MILLDDLELTRRAEGVICDDAPHAARRAAFILVTKCPEEKAAAGAKEGALHYDDQMSRHANRSFQIINTGVR
jgi:hypothetical protein